MTNRRRIYNAVKAFAINFVFWVVVPSLLAGFMTGRVTGSPLTTPSFVIEFGALFIILDVGAALTEGMAVSVPFLSAVAVLSAVYLWLATNGGDLNFAAGGIAIGLQFRLLVYVFVLPSIWGVFKAPLSYLIWRRAPIVPAPASPS